MNKFSLIEITKKNVKKVSDDVWKKYFDMRIQFDERPGSKTPFLDQEQLKKIMTNRFEKDKNFISINIILKDEDFHGFVVFASVPNSPRKKYLEVFYNSVHLDSDKEIIQEIAPG